MKKIIFAGMLLMFALMVALVGALSGGVTALLAGLFTSEVKEETLQQAARNLLRERPELVREVLRNNSELVFEVTRQGGKLHKRKATLAQWEKDLKVAKTLSLAGGFIRGKTDAPVKVVAYADMGCRFCAMSHAALTPLLKKYGDDVMYVFKPLPQENDDNSAVLALYVVSAFLQNTEKGWRFYDAIFAQPDIFTKGGEAALRALAKEMGLDIKKFEVDRASELILSVRQEANNLQDRGTPPFFINDLVVRDPVSQDLFEDAIVLALKHAKQ